MAASRAASAGPFLHCTAWFSSSVDQETIRLWKQYGGACSDCSTAQYLFGTGPDDRDVIQVYSNSFGIAVFKSEWIHQVIESNKDKGHTNIAQFLIIPSPKEEEGAPEPAVFGNPELFKSAHYVKKKQKTINQPLYITIDPKATGTRLRHVNDIGAGAKSVRFLDFGEAKHIMLRRKKINEDKS
ncbi:PREDICTED: uncharacterized protein LOC109584766 [Amphimedon queenslandica]|nr:PREDICTED: uncharacterized protein LOC109584766 [Amphimedon queenslandica]|eukprot:XP_019856173.1 PREDICTED: uncharacterized protein LOC109584766 [Amphimedon queenslandica]